MKAYLKIKIKSLAAEATMIHREERRHNIGHRGRVRIRRQLARANDLTHAQRARLERRLAKPSESRASHIAYGFLNGLPYNRVEANCKTPPNWSRVEDLVRKYGEDDVRVWMQRFAEWKEVATSAEKR